MSAHDGTKATIAALLANAGIAVAKFVAWGISGSSAMLAEGVHSVADSGNQLLLLRGGRKAKKAADAEHPFGYGRERYVSAFVVAIILFSLGGLFSIYEGVEKLSNPHPLEQAWLPVTVLLIAIVLESLSLRTAIGEADKVRAGQSWFQYIRRAKAPELPVVLLEDLAALLGLVLALGGVGLTILTGDPFWDAVGTLCIGALLILVAVVLGIETKSLLIGEGATAREVAYIRRAALAGDEIERIIHLKTLYLGPDELMVAMKVAMPGTRTVTEASASIDAVETRMREAVPAARVIYIEPAVFRSPAGAEAAPATDVFVIKGAD